MDNDKTKAQSFIELLPQIYKRILISKEKYRVICNWLKKEHGLDFFEKSDEEDDSAKTYYLFTNYLRKYGDLKKAKEYYTQNVNTNIEEFWWKDFVDENNKPIGTTSQHSNQISSTSSYVDSKASNIGDTSNKSVGVDKKPKPKVDTASLSQALGLDTKPKGSIDYNAIDPLEDFDDSLVK